MYVAFNEAHVPFALFNAESAWLWDDGRVDLRGKVGNFEANRYFHVYPDGRIREMIGGTRSVLVTAKRLGAVLRLAAERAKVLGAQAKFAKFKVRFIKLFLDGRGETVESMYVDGVTLSHMKEDAALGRGIYPEGERAYRIVDLRIVG